MSRPRNRFLPATWVGWMILTGCFSIAHAHASWLPFPAPPQRISSSPSHGQIHIEWHSNPQDPARPWVEFRRSGMALQEPTQFQIVAMESPKASDPRTLPSMAGQWEKQSEGWRFSPQFPLLPGVTYQALCYEREGWNSDPGIPILASVPFQMARSRSSSRAQVEAIYPSASKLPANLLKFYIHFSAPMSRGHIYQHIHLVETTGQPTEMPFLEVDEELWDPTLTRLTLFFDPGRIKRGVEPLESIGPSLIEGHRYRLTIDRDWLDASGTPLRRSFSKTFLVGPPDRSPLDIDQWKTLPPEEGSRHPLRIQFPKPIDHALGLRLFRVIEVGSGTIQGVATLSHEESSWSWIPEQPWRSGRYEVVVPDILEDVCGNNLHKPFDVDLLEPLNPLLSDSVSRISFTVESSARSKHP